MIKKEQMLNKGTMSGVLTTLLNYSVVEVEFTKVNGDFRKMSCTKSLLLIPEDKHPIGKSTKELNKNVVRVYDVEADGWRSFQAESVTAFRFIHDDGSREKFKENEL